MWPSNERIRRLTRVDGLEHVEAARASGRGALLLSAHFNSIEIGCRALAARLPRGPRMTISLHSRASVGVIAGLIAVTFAGGLSYAAIPNSSTKVISVPTEAHPSRRPTSSGSSG